MNTGFVTMSHSIPADATARNRATWVRLASLGVVFGDLGTSPLYTLQTVVQAMGGRFAPPSAISSAEGIQPAGP